MIEVKQTKLLFFCGIIAISTMLLTQPIKFVNGQGTLISVNPFVIDDLGVDGYTWEEISLQSWCSGNGTEENPYIIENIRINHTPIASGHCLAIKNSNVHFIVRYSEFHDAGGRIIEPPQSWGGSGICLYNTSNGIIANNTCYNNVHSGIELVSEAKSNLIINNSCSGNAHGIQIGYLSENNTVIKNIIGTNENFGIYTYRAYLNRIVNNSIKGDYDGSFHKVIYMRESDRNIVSGNLLDHGITGIELEISDYNNITNNTIHYYRHTVQEVGVNNHYCEGNIIEDNMLIFDDFVPPYISINEPQEYQTYNSTSPTFDLYIVERLTTGIDSQWYSLDNGISNYSFSITNFNTGTDSYGQFIAGDGIGAINQEFWSNLENGNITIQFYVKDGNGNIAVKEVTVEKNVPEPTPNGLAVQGFNLLIFIGIIGISCVLLIFKRLKKTT